MWNNHTANRDGVSSARFCAPSRRIALTKGSRPPVTCSANRSAFRSLALENAFTSGVAASMTAPAASSSKGIPAGSDGPVNPSGPHHAFNTTAAA